MTTEDSQLLEELTREKALVQEHINQALEEYHPGEVIHNRTNPDARIRNLYDALTCLNEQSTELILHYTDTTKIYHHTGGKKPI